MTHSYSRARFIANVVAEDLLLPVAFAVIAIVGGGVLGTALLVAIPIVMAWGVFTLHFPRRIEHTPEGITFTGYGRAHTFLWRDVEHVRVRRFLVRDRVLVRLTPSPAWRGRYWVLSSIGEFDALVKELERRAEASCDVK